MAAGDIEEELLWWIFLVSWGVGKSIKEEIIMFMDNSTETAPEYFTLPRKLENYKWYKPLLTALLGVAIYFALSIVLTIISCVLVAVQGKDVMEFLYSYSGGYDTLDSYSAVGAFLTMGSIVVMIPSLVLALLVTKERPFRTITSATGKWNMNFFLKGLVLALIANGIPQVVLVAMDGGFNELNIKFTVVGFIIFLILVPFQCIAEEYVFRGFLGQTIGAWVKRPLVGILLSTLVFTLCHPYNLTGKLVVFLTGATLCFAAWYIKGIEAASALHYVNNFFSFVLSGIGATAISSEVRTEDLFVDLIMNLVFIALMILMDKKFKWFSK
jgi:membrane protease YdiL (CAAX protease family)